MDNPLIPAVKYATLITEGDGVQTAWEFNFAGGYISPEHVKAFTEDMATGQLVIRPLTLIGPNTAQIVPAVADGLRLVIYRDTPKTEPLVNYSTGSILNESSLDKSNQQAVFIAAELADRVIADYDFSNALLYAVTTATNANNVANAIDGKATTALANSASAIATATGTVTALAAANGAAMVNGAAQVVTTVAAIRGLVKTSPSKHAIVNGKTTPTVNGNGTYYLDEADLVTPDDNFFTIVAADGGRWKRNRLIWQTTTSGSDAPVSQIARNTSHTGGAFGTVTNALNVSAVVGAGVTNFEWSFLSQMDNFATAGENVAIYGQTKKRSTGPSWAACMEIQDHNVGQPSVGGAIGIELACSANGGDTNFQRVGVHVAMGKLNPAGLDCEWGHGVWTTAGTASRFGKAFSNDAPCRVAAFSNAGDSSGIVGAVSFLDTGKSTNGIDLSGATYTNDAIRMKAGQRISFDVNATVSLREVAGSLVLSGGRLQMASGFGVSGAGNISGTASAGTSGALPAQVAGYLTFLIDGATFKLPYYGP